MVKTVNQAFEIFLKLLFEIFNMVKKRKDINKKIKNQIIEEAGYKCANPGCPNWRAEIHHIKEWAVFGSNDPSILIALCPSCHDAVHNGKLKIPDELLYSWKSIQRKDEHSFAHLYVEPSQEIKLLTGQIALTTINNNITIFEISNQNRFSFRLLNNNIVLINLTITSLSGKEVLNVIDNYTNVYAKDSVTFNYIPGHIKIFTKNADLFISSESVRKMRTVEPDFLYDNELILLELQVVKPGHIKVKGCWSDKDYTIIITDQSLAFIKDSRKAPLRIMGGGDNTVIRYIGSVDCALFGFRDKNTGALKI
ncbi:HNH endonuclease [Aulosira sp. FACHB-615]|uniref:HNH endonuclease n=1 Tax=Aulosira sp. FACHB-615 TaxID=2692777 RepID=UPI0016857643|nr:HNH endonuclease [Aulosira sp. FACHB-615]MBD2491986.1 HNH endonuclease [Aulosira sp. FACHB-615]